MRPQIVRSIVHGNLHDVYHWSIVQHHSLANIAFVEGWQFLTCASNVPKHLRGSTAFYKLLCLQREFKNKRLFLLACDDLYQKILQYIMYRDQKEGNVSCIKCTLKYIRYNMNNSTFHRGWRLRTRYGRKDAYLGIQINWQVSKYLLYGIVHNGSIDYGCCKRMALYLQTVSHPQWRDIHE